MKRKRKVGLQGCSEVLPCLDPDDRISRLPDDILLQILTSMRIKEATATGLLSRRWRYLSASLPRLEFDYYILNDESPPLYRPKQESEFIKRGRRVIESYKGHNVDDFRLIFALRKVHTGFLDQCVRFVLSNKVRNLELDLNLPLGVYNPAEPYVFQPVALNKGDNPSFDSLKSLKSLCLKSVIMVGDVLQGLLSTCRFLETLTLCNVSNLGCVKVVGTSLRLKHLEMVSCPGLDEMEICDAPIVSLKRWWCGEAAIRMNKVPHLVQLSMSTCFKAAAVGISGLPKSQPADEISFFSSCLSQLESLKLRLSSLYDRNPLEPKVLYMVSQLTKLRELEILCEPDLVNDLLLLVPLIEALQNLQKIVIRVLRAPTIENIETRTFEEGAAPSLKSREVEGRPGMLQHLKVLEFAGYRVGTTEDEFISYIANNAAALESIIIDPSYQNEPSFYPPGEEARNFEELVYCVAKQWLDKIVPPGVELVIQGLKEVDPRKLHYWDGILRQNLAYNVAFLFFALDD